MMDKIEQRHRVAAANKIKGDDSKSVAVREKILGGEADEHPSVQAAAFYEADAALALARLGYTHRDD